LDPPREHDSGLVSCVDAEACFPYFFDYYGCSICIRVCPFQEREYSALKRSFDKRNNRIAR
jgi:epoxyqueuosine reductase QueG